MLFLQKEELLGEEIMQHVFIVGAKSLGAYGGYETFVNKLTEYHQNLSEIKYHVACKANGNGCMDETLLEGVEIIDANEFIYHNAHCFKLKVPDIGAAQAIYYDIVSLNYCCSYIKKNQIKNPIIYILACRIGPFTKYFMKKIHAFGGKLYINPDGHEFLRAKWSPLIRQYWKMSEQLMVKYSDYIICDSINIEKYIHEKYKKYHPETGFIAYGAETRNSLVGDNDKRILEWYRKNNLSAHEYYLVVGRFVPENNYEIMIREYMKSNSKKDFAIVTNVNENFLNELERKLHFKSDRRIKFVGTVYDQELLMKIRENAYGYFHGHEVGGTNPSLLEALGSTNLNLLLRVGFNEEVAQDAALYWNKENGNLSNLINMVENMEYSQIIEMGQKAKKRVKEAYSWECICNRYLEVFLQ